MAVIKNTKTKTAEDVGWGKKEYFFTVGRNVNYAIPLEISMEVPQKN
jgi:hypothetical protein